FFFLQFFIINGMGAYMLTPAFAEGQASLWSGTAGILGWDKLAFYNPSFLMLTLHRTAANFAYAGFVVAGVCGVLLYRAKREKIKAWYESGGRFAFKVAFISFLTLPIIGFFYSWVLKYHAKEAYDNLMVGRGDVVAGGIDWWWTKQLVVAAMIGIGLVFGRKSAKAKREFALPMAAVYVVSLLYLMFYVGMAIQMTWLFLWGSLAAAIVAGLWASHLVNRYEGSGRAVFVTMGILSFLTVCLGGYVREASRPRFVSPSGQQQAGFNRIQQYSKVYHPAERPENIEMRMVRGTAPHVAGLPERSPLVELPPETAADLVSARCISCHTLERIYRYKGTDWDRVVGRMKAYGTRLNGEEAAEIADYLESGELQRNTSIDVNEAMSSE
ncbi:MAG: cytochrome c, partial [Phycisphaerales bacterium]